MTTQDAPLHHTLRQAVDARLDDPTLSVDDLCAAAHLSRAQLHRRLKTLTGLSATHFIRELRLQRARTLLEQTDLPIGQVALEVGFRDAAYFRACSKFHQWATNGKFSFSLR